LIQWISLLCPIAGSNGSHLLLASCCLFLECSLTRLAHDEIHFAGLSTTSDA
jgi:hypothetical protein